MTDQFYNMMDHASNAKTTLNQDLELLMINVVDNADNAYQLLENIFLLTDFAKLAQITLKSHQIEDHAIQLIASITNIKH